MGYGPIFQVLKLFQVVCFNCITMAFRCPVLAPDTTICEWFLCAGAINLLMCSISSDNGESTFCNLSRLENNNPVYIDMIVYHDALLM